MMNKESIPGKVSSPRMKSKLHPFYGPIDIEAQMVCWWHRPMQEYRIIGLKGPISGHRPIMALNSLIEGPKRMSKHFLAWKWIIA